MYNDWGNRTDTGLCDPLRSVSLNCQLMTKLEIIGILQAQVCSFVRAHLRLSHQKTKSEASDASRSQPNQAS